MNQRLPRLIVSSALIAAMVACTLIVIVYSRGAQSTAQRVASVESTSTAVSAAERHPTDPYRLVRLAASRISHHDYPGFRALFDPHESLPASAPEIIQRTLDWPALPANSAEPLAQYVRPTDVSAWRDPVTDDIGFSLRLVSLYATDTPAGYDSKAFAIKQTGGAWYLTSLFGEAPYVFVSPNGDGRQLFDPVSSVPGLEALRDRLAADVHVAPEAVVREVAFAIAEHGSLDDPTINWLHGPASDQQKLQLRTASAALRSSLRADNVPARQATDVVEFPVGGGSGVVTVERRTDGRWYLARISAAPASKSTNPSVRSTHPGAGALVAHWNAARVAGDVRGQNALLSANGKRSLLAVPEIAASRRDPRIVRASTAWVQTNGGTAYASVQEYLASPKKAHRWLVLTLHFNGSSWRIAQVTSFSWAPEPAP